MNILSYYLRNSTPNERPLSHILMLPLSCIHLMTYRYGDNYTIKLYIDNKQLYSELYNDSNSLVNRCIFKT